MNQITDKTKKLLLAHSRAYPHLQIEDIFKFLYQSAFGCEHMVTSAEAAADYILQEYDRCSPVGEAAPEALDGAYGRVPLSCMDQGLSAKTLAKLFIASAKKEAGGLSDLLQKLDAARDLVREQRLPFSPEAFENAAAQWAAMGYPAIHHSEVFRQAYRPSYRVIAREYIPFLPLFAALDRLTAKGCVRLAVEGGSAGGKTTLGNILADIYDGTAFHMDDFFLRPEQRTPERFAEPGGNIDYERFETEVLVPLSQGHPVRYRKLDCATGLLTDPETVIPEKTAIIEGVYSMHPRLAEYYDFSVFLDIPPELQRQRILRRNTPEPAKRFFEEWLPLENTYFTERKIKQRCDMIIYISEEE